MAAVDDASFEGCYQRVYPLVLAKCRRMLKGDSDATDLAQDVFVRLWHQRELVRDPQALTAWLYRTSTRLVIDRARRRALSRDGLWCLEVALEGSGAEAEAQLVSRQQLRSLVSECPPDELEAAILSRVDRLTHPEVASVMGVGERTVRRLLDRFDQRASQFKETA